MKGPNYFWNSIRWRIFTYYTLLITTAVSLLVAAYVVGNRHMEKTVLRTQMQAVAVRFLPIVFPPPGGADLSRPSPGNSPEQRRSYRNDAFQQHRDWEESLADLRQRDFFLKIWDREGRTLYESDNTPARLETPEWHGRHAQFEVIDTPQCLGVLVFSPGGLAIVGQEEGRIPGSILQALYHAVPIGLLVVLACSIIGYAIIRTSLRPIAEMSTAARNILDGNLSGRFPAGMQRNELEMLAQLLNRAFQRVQNAYNRQVQFTADASHELRTPVASILADCQFSLDKPRPPERYLETIEVCRESAQHMRLLLDQLGVLAAFDHPDLPIERERIDLAEICQAALNVAGPLAHQAGIRLRDDLASGREVIGDALRLSQAIINLLKNAIHYNRKGGSVTLRIRTEDTEALVEVEDTGVGIPGDRLESIFERFTRLDKSRSTEHHNFGLGLAITQSIVRAHDGRITVSSVVGKGSVFRIILPQAKG